MKKILIMHGPNINLTGIREPGHYGRTPFAEMNEEFVAYAKANGADCDVFHSNHEGELIDRLHAAMGVYDGIVLNAGAYTHYSYAIRDAIAAIQLPVVEVHMSNVHKREEFRHHSYAGMACVKSFVGLGLDGYRQAILFLRDYCGMER